VLTNMWSFTKAARKAIEPSADDNVTPGGGCHKVKFKGVYLSVYKDRYVAGVSRAAARGQADAARAAAGVCVHNSGCC
jgi:hypothetical protein